MMTQSVLALEWNPAVGIPLLILSAIALALIWIFGQPKKEPSARRAAPSPQAGERREPTLGEQAAADEASFSAFDDALVEPLGGERVKPQQGELDVNLREELDRLGATLSGDRATAKPLSSRLAGHAASIVDALRAPAGHAEQNATAIESAQALPAATKMPPRSELGRRPNQVAVERIITLFVVAREGAHFHGPDLVVAAEKAGLEFGDMGIYHRMFEGRREAGPIFSVANMLKPGNFDLGRLEALITPGVSFFMTLPGPLSALDAWDAMLPTAQRLAELLDGLVLDEERNALGRQRIAHIRDQLRGWDRDHEGKEIIFGR